MCSFVAADQEGEEEEDEDEEDEEDEDDDDEEDEAEEKNLKKMEEQRSQGKVRGCLKAFLFLLFRPFILSALSLSVPASQSDTRKDESRGPSAPGAGGKGRGETSRNHDDEEEREVPLRQDYVRKEAKNTRGLFKLFFFFVIDPVRVCLDKIVSAAMFANRSSNIVSIHFSIRHLI